MDKQNDKLIVGICGQFYECDTCIEKIGIFENIEKYNKACEHETKENEKQGRSKFNYDYTYFEIPKSQLNHFGDF